MQVIKEFSRPPSALLRELSAYDSATVHEAYGGKGALQSDLKPLDNRMKVCGPAATVSARPGDNLILHKAIYVAAKGDVLVVIETEKTIVEVEATFNGVLQTVLTPVGETAPVGALIATYREMPG